MRLPAKKPELPLTPNPSPQGEGGRFAAPKEPVRPPQGAGSTAIAKQFKNTENGIERKAMSMWLQLPDGTVFNLNTAKSLKVGSVAGHSENWALLAEMPTGEDVVLVEYHSPQGAQRAQDEIVKALKHGKTCLDLT